MIHIEKITIKNFKSIKEVTIPFNNYGNDEQGKCMFLVGLNESGKSAVLEAISMVATGLDNCEYEEACHLSAQDEDEYIDLYAHYKFEMTPYTRTQLIEKCNLPKELVYSFKIDSIVKNVYRNSKSANSSFSLEITNLDYSEYFVETANSSVNGKILPVDKVRLVKEIFDKDQVKLDENAPIPLASNQVILTKDKLESIIIKNLELVISALIPKIQMWRPTSEYLINESVSLSEFAIKPSISQPLKNIFHIYGKKKDEEIKVLIEKSLKSQARTDELRDKLSASITKHINRIWKEHKIKIRLSINGDECEVHVEDKDRNYAYYKMQQRSDGFKQFISLILSLSAQNESQSLRNSIILIDEPEVHLHPSGIKYMRDELLKIGKDNHVIVSTHSQYMIDTNCPERHWIVKKEKSETTITQVDESTSVVDDSVLASAFGLSLFKELLPDNIIIVEGGDDKKIISHSIKQIKAKFFYSIKSAGGASKIPGLSTLMNDESVSAFIVFDDDKEGRDHKRKVVEDIKGNFSHKNVFTIKDINPILPPHATTEDLLPASFVLNFFNTELNETFVLNEEEPFIIQLKNQSRVLKENKQKLDSLKIKLSNQFCNEYDSKSKIETKCPRLNDFILNLIKKIEDRLTD